MLIISDNVLFISIFILFIIELLYLPHIVNLSFIFFPYYPLPDACHAHRDQVDPCYAEEAVKTSSDSMRADYGPIIKHRKSL